MNSCILPDQLQNYLGGRVSQATSDMVVSHLKACANCRALLSRLTPQPVAILQAAHTLPGDSKEFEPELLSVLSIIGEFRSVSGVGSASTSSTQTSDSLVVWDGLVLGNYQIHQKLGEGGMGTVYLATHLRLNKTVALKFLRADRARNPQAIARFEKEWLAVGPLNHPHIVRATDAGELAGKYFLAMEFIGGDDLGRLVQANGRLQVPLACELIRQAALGLQHAHDHGLVHRDVKPSNLMLSPEGQVKVLDLGLAQLQIKSDDTSELTREGQLVGTWLYMAPEQLLGSSEVDSRSDVFSLGVTFYSLLNGGLSLSPGQRAVQLPSINSQRDDVPSDVQLLLEKMLSPRPEDRIQTMTDVASTLEPHSSGEFAVEIARKFGKSNASNRVPTGDANTQEPSRTPKDPVVISPSPPQPPPPSPPPPPPPRPYPWLKPAVAIGGGIAALLLLGVWAGLGFPGLRGNGGGEVVSEVPGHPNDTPPNDIPAETPVLGSLDLRPTDETGKKLPDGMPFEVSPVNEPGAPFRLTVGLHQLPIGKWTIHCDDPNVLIVPDVFNVAQGGASLVRAQQLPAVSWLYPRLPEKAGEFVAGTGTIWMRGMPVGDRLSYRVNLMMLGLEPGTKERWMKVEVTTMSATEDYKETGWLLVHSEAGSGQLKVTRGWVEGTSDRIASWLEYLYPLEKSGKLTVAFDRAKDGLDKRAKELHCMLPEARVSVHDVLVLLFDAADVRSAFGVVGLLRSQLAKESDRKVPTHELVPGIQGTDLYCSVHRSDKPEQEYAFIRHESVPFSIVQIDVNVPKMFIGGFKYTGHGLATDQISLPEGLAKAEADFEALKPDVVRFDEATIPKEAGAKATYFVGVSLGGGVEQHFIVEVRTVDVAKVGDASRWLEVVVNSTTPGHEFKEEALLHVVDERNSGGRFAVKEGAKEGEGEGWIRCRGEVLSFETSGDRLPLEVSLMKLGKRPPLAGLLTLNDVLTLLFAADLSSSKPIENLRTSVAAKLPKRSGMELEDIEVREAGKMLGEVYSISDIYRFTRSRKLPFSFNTVSFKTPGFVLTSELKAYKKEGAPSLLNISREALFAAALETDARLKSVEAVSDPENWHEWVSTDAGKSFREWAEFRGEVGDKDVLLWCQRESGKILERRISLSSLRAEDQDWVRQGRTWHAAKSGSTLRATYVRKTGDLGTPDARVWLSQEGGKAFEVIGRIDALSEADRDWIIYLEDYRKKNK